MTSAPDPLTADDLRRFASRIDSSAQEITARLVLHDGRFAALTDRLNQADRRADTTEARISARLGAIDRRFDVLDTRLDNADARLEDTLEQLVGHMRDYRARMRRITRLATIGTLTVNGLMLAGTLLLIH